MAKSSCSLRVRWLCYYVATWATLKMHKSLPLQNDVDLAFSTVFDDSDSLTIITLYDATVSHVCWIVPIDRTDHILLETIINTVSSSSSNRFQCRYVLTSRSYASISQFLIALYSWFGREHRHTSCQSAQPTSHQHHSVRSKAPWWVRQCNKIYRLKLKSLCVINM